MKQVENNLKEIQLKKRLSKEEYDRIVEMVVYLRGKNLSLEKEEDIRADILLIIEEGLDRENT